MLAEFVRVHVDARQRAREMVRSLDANQANWKPTSKSWSVLECIEHLILTMDGYASRSEKTIARAKEKGLRGSHPYGRGTFFGRFLVNALREGPKKKAPAPRAFKPKSSQLDRDAVIARFESVIDRYVALAAEADGLALGDMKIGSPVSALLRLSVAQAFEIHSHHTPRHLDQAERVVGRPGFPEPL